MGFFRFPGKFSCLGFRLLGFRALGSLGDFETRGTRPQRPSHSRYVEACPNPAYTEFAQVKGRYSLSLSIYLSISWAWGRVSVPGLQSPPHTLISSSPGHEGCLTLLGLEGPPPVFMGALEECENRMFPP